MLCIYQKYNKKKKNLSTYQHKCLSYSVYYCCCVYISTDISSFFLWYEKKEKRTKAIKMDICVIYFSGYSFCCVTIQEDYIIEKYFYSKNKICTLLTFFLYNMDIQYFWIYYLKAVSYVMFISCGSIHWKKKRKKVWKSILYCSV